MISYTLFWPITLQLFCARLFCVKRQTTKQKALGIKPRAFLFRSFPLQSAAGRFAANRCAAKRRCQPSQARQMPPLDELLQNDVPYYRLRQRVRPSPLSLQTIGTPFGDTASTPGPELQKAPG